VHRLPLCPIIEVDSGRGGRSGRRARLHSRARRFQQAIAGWHDGTWESPRRGTGQGGTREAPAVRPARRAWAGVLVERPKGVCGTNSHRWDLRPRLGDCHRLWGWTAAQPGATERPLHKAFDRFGRYRDRPVRCAVRVTPHTSAPSPAWESWVEEEIGNYANAPGCRDVLDASPKRMGAGLLARGSEEWAALVAAYERWVSRPLLSRCWHRSRNRQKSFRPPGRPRRPLHDLLATVDHPARC
jgi:hypothetical protein